MDDSSASALVMLIGCLILGFFLGLMIADLGEPNKIKRYRCTDNQHEILVEDKDGTRVWHQTDITCKE